MSMSAPLDPDQAGGGLPGDDQPDTDRLDAEVL